MVVGNSAAALSAIRAIRAKGSTHSITLISREDCCAYSPVLTTYYLSDRIQEKTCLLYVTENVTHLFGLAIAAIGMTKVKDEDKHMEELKVMDFEKKLYRKMVVNGNRLIGTVLLGDIQDMGVIRNIIVNSVDISPFKSDIPKIPLNHGKSILFHSIWD